MCFESYLGSNLNSPYGDEGIYDLCACVIKLEEMERNQVRRKVVMVARRRSRLREGTASEETGSSETMKINPIDLIANALSCLLL